MAALVRVPLTSIVSLPRAGIRTPADLRGKTVGTAGIDYQSAYLQAVLAKAGVPRSSVKQRGVGFDLVPALLSGKVDAVLGAYWNYEAIQLREKGRDPQVIRIEQAGVPTYDELVIAASESDVRDHPDRIRKFLAALAAGTQDLDRQPRRRPARRQPRPRPQAPARRREGDPPLLQAEGRQPVRIHGPRRVALVHHVHALERAAEAVEPDGAFTNALLPAAGG